MRKRNTNTKYRLRKIVRYYTNYWGTIIEVLECGHEQAERQDIYGATNAYRRKCRNCLKGESHE